MPCTEIVHAAARNLRRTPSANTSMMQLRPNTSAQRRTQPLFTSYLSDILTEYNSPEQQISKQSDAERINVSSQKHKPSHQKQHRPAFRITAAPCVWGTFFIAHTVQNSTVNKQQLPEFERGS